jgi:hypothetical protein
MHITFKRLQYLFLVLCALVSLPRPGSPQGAETDAYGGSTRVRWEATGWFRLQQNERRFWCNLYNLGTSAFGRGTS